MKVKVTEYNGDIVIETLESKTDVDFVPVGPGKIGSVLINTKEHLGMSQEAFDIMKSMKRSHDCIGEVEGWKCDDGKHCFGWLGALERLVPHQAELSRDGFDNIDFIKIPNETSPHIVELIKIANAEEVGKEE